MLEKDLHVLESVEIIGKINYEDLPDVAIQRLRCEKNQKNVLVRISLCHLSKTLTKTEANGIYTKIYEKVNYGKNGYKVS